VQMGMRMLVVVISDHERFPLLLINYRFSFTA